MAHFTVADVIRKLKKFPQNAIVCIDDPDTNWTLKVSEVRVGQEFEHPIVYIASDYGQQLTQEDFK